MMYCNKYVLGLNGIDLAVQSYFRLQSFKSVFTQIKWGH